MDTAGWYASLIKPAFAPPAWLFGPVWAVLYLVILVSYGYVVWLYFKKDLPFMVLLPFVLNVVFNLVFTPIQVGLRSNVLACVDIVLLVATLVWALVAIWPHARWVALVNVPYLLWGAFATVLQFTLTWLNRSPN